VIWTSGGLPGPAGRRDTGTVSAEAIATAATRRRAGQYLAGRQDTARSLTRQRSREFAVYMHEAVATERQRSLRDYVQKESRARQVRAMTRVSRRAKRAERNLVQAQCEAMRLRAELALRLDH